MLILIYLFDAIFSGHPGGGRGKSTLGNAMGTPRQILHYDFHKSLDT